MIACDYCGDPARLVLGSEVYPSRTDLHRLYFYFCSPCDALVGCHKPGSYHIENGQRIDHVGTEPLGRLANSELRSWKKRAHAAFDPIWQTRKMSRNRAYAWLAQVTKISSDKCHIGMFDIDNCEAVIDAVDSLIV